MSTQYTLKLMEAIDNTAGEKGIVYRDWDDINQNLTDIEFNAIKNHVRRKGFGMIKWGSNIVILCDANNGEPIVLVDSDPLANC